MSRILVIDDLADFAESLTRVVQAAEYAAKCVTDPRVAVEAAREFRRDLVLLDIGMPYINGYELAPMLRKALEPPRLRIAAVTAWGSDTDRQLSKSLGFDAHLVKPISEGLLRHTLEEFFS